MSQSKNFQFMEVDDSWMVVKMTEICPTPKKSVILSDIETAKHILLNLNCIPFASSLDRKRLTKNKKAAYIALSDIVAFLMSKGVPVTEISNLYPDFLNFKKSLPLHSRLCDGREIACNMQYLDLLIKHSPTLATQYMSMCIRLVNGTFGYNLDDIKDRIKNKPNLAISFSINTNKRYPDLEKKIFSKKTDTVLIGRYLNYFCNTRFPQWEKTIADNSIKMQTYFSFNRFRGEIYEDFEKSLFIDFDHLDTDCVLSWYHRFSNITSYVTQIRNRSKIIEGWLFKHIPKVITLSDSDEAVSLMKLPLRLYMNNALRNDFVRLLPIEYDMCCYFKTEWELYISIAKEYATEQDLAELLLAS